MNQYDLIIIGGGAAGLAAAITFTQKCNGSVLVIDGNDEPGRKILATGNGRCNLTNTRAPGYDKSVEFFTSLGIALATEDEGRVYPMNRRASVVRDILVRAAKDGGTEFLLGVKVGSVARGDNDDFTVTLTDAEPKTAAQVIIATGGKAAPQFGSTGDGFAFARSLGITIDPILPSLTKLMYAESAAKKLSALKGVRVKAKTLLLADGAQIAESVGEVQFTDKALSGICIFDLSANYNQNKLTRENHHDENADYVVALDLAPDMEESDIVSLLSGNSAAGLLGIVNEKIAEYIEREFAADADSGNIISKMVHAVKNFEVPISGTAGWKEAQTTCGGVPMSELDSKHFEAKKAPGLYFAGEVISSNLPCGGYNLDFAWNTAIAAASRAAGFYNFSHRETTN
jgi:predicted Rossmann fold flavoprotein